MVICFSIDLNSIVQLQPDWQDPNIVALMIPSMFHHIFSTSFNGVHKKNKVREMFG